MAVSALWQERSRWAAPRYHTGAVRLFVRGRGVPENDRVETRLDEQPPISSDHVHGTDANDDSPGRVKPLALVPAKGKSGRIRKKNLAPLASKPLVQWTIDAAKASDLFGDERIYVASEDDEILRFAEQSSVQPLRRPDTLANPEATVEDVIKWARATLEYQGAMMVLLPTSPFRTPETMREAWGQFERRAARVLMSIVPSEHPPFWALLWEGDAIAPMMPSHYHRPRNMLPETYRHDGSYLIVTSGGTGICVFQPPWIETMDINTPEDLAYAEYLVATGRVKR